MDHNEHQKAYFSDRALPRMTQERSNTRYVMRHTTEVLSVLAPREGEVMIDIGCGLGKYTAAIASMGHEVHGLDLTPALIERFRVDLPNLPVYLADAAEPPAVLLGRYDSAVGFFFLHHVEDLRPVFQGVRAMLRPGGRAVFLEPNPLFLGYYLQVTFTHGMSWRGERGILRMRPGLVERAGRAAGFTSFEYTAFGAAPPALANRRWGRRIERAVESLPGWSSVGAFRLFTMS